MKVKVCTINIRVPMGLPHYLTTKGYGVKKSDILRWIFLPYYSRG